MSVPFEEFFRALKIHLGTPEVPELNTGRVRELFKFCQLWLDGDLEYEALQVPCTEMAGRIADAAEQLNELVTFPEQTRLVEAYLGLTDILNQLPVLALEDDVVTFSEALEEWAERQHIIKELSLAVEVHQSEPIQQCPRCLQETSTFCSDCQLSPFYLTQQKPSLSRTQLSWLPENYQRASEAFQNVLVGHCRLTDFLGMMGQLRAELEQLFELCTLALERTGDELEEIELQESSDALEVAIEGIDEMGEVETDQYLCKLSFAWNLFYDAIFALAYVLKRHTK